jgi:hypothetical protein
LNPAERIDAEITADLFCRMVNLVQPVYTAGQSQ